MKKACMLLLLALSLLLSACSGEAWRKAFAPPTLTLQYDDFGPERAASKFLGPRGARTVVIAHYGFNRITPSGTDDVRYVNVLQSMNFLRAEHRSLPPTTANEPLRQRLRTTYERLYPLQLKRYNNALGSSYTTPWVGMNRRLMLPALPPPTI